MLEAGHAGGEGVPVAARRGQLLEGQPAPVPDLDGIGAVPGREQPQDIALEKRRVHAELERERGAEPLADRRSEEHTSELQSHHDLVCRLLLEKKKKKKRKTTNA